MSSSEEEAHTEAPVTGNLCVRPPKSKKSPSVFPAAKLQTYPHGLSGPTKPSFLLSSEVASNLPLHSLWLSASKPNSSKHPCSVSYIFPKPMQKARPYDAKTGVWFNSLHTSHLGLKYHSFALSLFWLALLGTKYLDWHEKRCYHQAAKSLWHHDLPETELGGKNTRLYFLSLTGTELKQWKGCIPVSHSEENTKFPRPLILSIFSLMG